MPTVDAARLVRFGAFELDLDAGVLRRHGRRVPLQEQPARILALLVSRPGDVVTREELRQLVWTDDTFVEFDASLNAAITKIRRALGDSASAPRFIETLPKRGYRFLADVQGLQSGSESTAASASAVDAPSIAAPDAEAGETRGIGRGRRTALLGIAAATLVSAWLLSAGPAPRSRASLVRSLTVQPFEVHVEDMHPNLGSELAAAIGRRLGRLQTLTVKPWPPGATADPSALSRELKVDGRLDGVVTRTGPQLAIALRLVSTDGERPLWEEVVSLPVSDLMWLESQIAQRVGAALDVVAYAWVANTYAPLAYLGFAPPWETGPAQRAAAEKALLLDAGLAEAHLALAMVLAVHERRWEDAEAEYHRALELDPNYATGRHWYGFFLQTLGRFDEALSDNGRSRSIR